MGKVTKLLLKINSKPRVNEKGSFVPLVKFWIPKRTLKKVIKDSFRSKSILSSKNDNKLWNINFKILLKDKNEQSSLAGYVKV